MAFIFKEEKIDPVSQELDKIYEGKVLTVKFFVLEQGSEPVRKWLKEELSQEQRKAVGEDIKTVEFNWPIGIPTVRKIEKDLWEVRTKFDDGIARAFFTVAGDEMVLLHGIRKKTQKTPLDDLETARKRLRLFKWSGS